MQTAAGKDQRIGNRSDVYELSLCLEAFGGLNGRGPCRRNSTTVDHENNSTKVELFSGAQPKGMKNPSWD